MGLAQGASLRIATDRTKMAMPETMIGLFPDVGGGYFLGRCNGPACTAYMGEYLALTGYVLRGDAEQSDEAGQGAESGGDAEADAVPGEGSIIVTEAQLRDIHGAGYPPAIAAGAQAVMASFNSVHGQRMHGHKALLTDVLKDRMNFGGFEQVLEVKG